MISTTPDDLDYFRRLVRGIASLGRGLLWTSYYSNSTGPDDFDFLLTTGVGVSLPWAAGSAEIRLLRGGHLGEWPPVPTLVS